MGDFLREKLGLSAHEKRDAASFIGKIKGLTTFFADALKATKDTAPVKAIAEAVPWWAEATGTALTESVPVVKFAVELFSELTKENDPHVLGLLACTLAYQRSVEDVFRLHCANDEAKQVAKDVNEKLSALDFSADLDFRTFSFRTALKHEFTTKADAQFAVYADALGYSQDQQRVLLQRIHRRFVANLKTLVSHGKLREKFQPFVQLMALGTDEEAAYDALLSHIEYQRWQFEEAPVFGKEPFALAHVYIESECGVIKWGELQTRTTGNGAREDLDPFNEKCGGRHDLLERVLSLIADPKFSDAIVIQGVAGAGKSSFTLRLAAELHRLGLMPIRIRLRDLPLDRHVSEALPRALFPPDRELPEAARGRSVEDPFIKGAIFNEQIQFREHTICPYVLILDGWDEISISAAEGFKIRVNRMLEQIRTEYLRRPGIPIRVILTGRPSTAVEDSTFLRDTTPLLTVRPLHPAHLRKFVDDLRSVLALRPVSPTTADISFWEVPEQSVFEPVFRKYEQEYEKVSGREHAESVSVLTGSMEVLGLPLLAHLAVRLIAQWPGDKAELVSNPTTLYRSMIDLTCEKGGKLADDPVELQNIHRVPGARLRQLLHRTAAAMTVHGGESISYRELALRLKMPGDELDKATTDLATRHSLSALLIAFFFKGGHTHLGCEFLHKSFREYLFAEAIIEALKDYGRQSPKTLPERQVYWIDFDSRTDPRFALSRSLAELLAPQWLSLEVVQHIGHLIAREIERSSKPDLWAVQPSSTGALTPISIDQWETVRDALADVWDWWAEGVHMRPQPIWNRRSEAEFGRCYADELVEFDLPFDRNGQRELAPARTTTMDAHLGDGIFRLNTLVHFHTAVQRGWLELTTGRTRSPKKLWEGVSEIGEGPRRCQTRITQKDGSWVIFAPSGKDPRFFAHYTDRINAAAWRIGGPFLCGTDLRGVDLRACQVYIRHDRSSSRPVVWRYANLATANAELGAFWESDFSYVFAPHVQFSGAGLGGATFEHAFLEDAQFQHAYLRSADFSQAELGHAQFKNSFLESARFKNSLCRNILLEGAILQGTQGLTEALNQSGRARP